MRKVPQKEFHRLAAAGRSHTRAVAVRHVSVGKPKVYDDGSRRVRFCFSDGSTDRMGDTIAPDGWDTSDYKANPVALWAHDSSAPPIGRASNVGLVGPRLMGDI